MFGSVIYMVMATWYVCVLPEPPYEPPSAALSLKILLCQNICMTEEPSDDSQTFYQHTLEATARCVRRKDIVVIRNT